MNASNPALRFLASSARHGGALLGGGVFLGVLVPPLASTTDVPSRTMALPSALSVAMKYHFLPP